MSAVLELPASQRKQIKKKPEPAIDAKLKAMFDQVRKEASKIPASKRIRDVSALIEKGRRFGA